jgi:hypothetical protein
MFVDDQNRREYESHNTSHTIGCGGDWWYLYTFQYTRNMENIHGLCWLGGMLNIPVVCGWGLAPRSKA